MPSPFQLLALAMACTALALSSCRAKFKPDFEAVLSFADTGESVSEETLADELRERAKLLSLNARVDPGPAGDHRLGIRFEAADKDEALAQLDALCQFGQLSVRVVHDQSVYLTDAVRSDPSKLPADHEILTFTLLDGERTKTEDLVVETAEIVNSSHVESAEAEAGKAYLVHISLTIKGGQQMLAATNKMQKGRSRLAIIYDERIISAPVVVGVLGAEITLVGFSSIEEAQAVSASLNKPLSTQLLIESLMPLAR